MIDASEVTFSAIRAQGAGGQNVNKVASAIHLRFDIQRSSLSADHKARLLQYRDQRINKDGSIVIKAQEHRTQAQNRVAALARLNALIAAGTRVATPRKRLKPTLGMQRRRKESKIKTSQRKATRKKVSF